jgi:hypothetical protein
MKVVNIGDDPIHLGTVNCHKGDMSCEHLATGLSAHLSNDMRDGVDYIRRIGDVDVLVHQKESSAANKYA